MNVRPLIGAIAFAACLFLYDKAVPAQPLNEEFVSATGDPGAAAVHADRPTMTADATPATMVRRTKERGLLGALQDAGSNPREVSLLSGLLLPRDVRDLRPEEVEAFWHNEKGSIASAIGALKPQDRARLASALDSLLAAMNVYTFDRGHIRDALADRNQIYVRWQKDGGLYARSLREIEDELAAKTKALGVERDGLILADKLWTAGGDGLLFAVTRVGAQLRNELEAVASPLAPSMSAGKSPAN
jgi:hypothetical protein